MKIACPVKSCKILSSSVIWQSSVDTRGRHAKDNKVVARVWTVHSSVEKRRRNEKTHSDVSLHFVSILGLVVCCPATTVTGTKGKGDFLVGFVSCVADGCPLE